jgi:hypothetical protein
VVGEGREEMEFSAIGRGDATDAQVTGDMENAEGA